MCGLVPWGRLVLGALCDMLVNQLVDLEELCTKPPPTIPEIDWLKELIPFPGQFVSPNQIAFWYAVWVNAHWQLYCECIPSTGTGPCPPLPEFGGPVTARGWDTFVLQSRQPIVPGWTDFYANMRRGTDSMPGTAFVAMLLEDANQQPLEVYQIQRTVNLASGGTDRRQWGALWSSASRAAARYVSLWSYPSGGAGQDQFTYYTYNVYMSIDFVGDCSGIVVTPPPPTPQPDPIRPPDVPDQPLPAECTASTICALLMAIMGQTRYTGSIVTVLQRYGLPFGYELGPAHPGLFGSGSFAIRGLVGVRVDITSALPGRQLEGTPPYIWDLGWMSIMTPEGMIMEQRITRDTQVWQPQLMQEATTFGYYFKAGVVGTITELQPEPYAESVPFSALPAGEPHRAERA